MRTAFIETLCELAASDPRIWLLAGDVGFSVVERFSRRFPDRFVNAGVAEQNLTGVAAGLALSGKVAFTYSIANFPTLRCLEQIRNDVCYHRCNVKIVSVGGGFAYGAQGYTHHGLEDLAILRTLPGMTVVAPGDPVEARLATRAIAAHPGPCYLRLGKSGEPVVHQGVPPFELGKALLVRDGRDVTLIATGSMLKPAADLAGKLAADGADVRVVSMPTIKPLDEGAILRAAEETRGIITLEEHTLTGGLGDAVASVLAARAGRHVAFAKVGAPDSVDWRVGDQKQMTDFLAAVPAIVRRMLGTRGPAGG